LGHCAKKAPVERSSGSEHLSRISTLWTVVRQAHQGGTDTTAAAQAALLERYGGAVYRYLVGALRAPEMADDLFQEFALRFVRGDFRRADPGRGRFRDYVRTALIHLVNDYHRARQKWPAPLADDAPAPAETSDNEDAFRAGWRSELLERTWQALAEAHPAYHAVLLLRVDNPDLPSAEMAARLGLQLDKSCTAAWVRKTLQRAHTRYAELLLDEVARTLSESTPAALAAELTELDLLRYCRSVLDRRNERT
jgi:RNA polymerase sigma-70 factor (ECF subfamily)